MDKLKTIYNNSKYAIKFINIFNLVLMKFKYMFKMAMSLNLDKKNFNEFLSQISKAFEDGLYFHGFQTEFIKNLTSIHHVHHDHVNLVEFLQII